jgi:probable phosphoglycerate mutase
MSADPSQALTTPGYRHRGLEELFRLARERSLTLMSDAFIFVRHGETDGNFSKIFQTADQPLNARGLQQAERAAVCLTGHRLRRVAASTMRRAWHTAEIVAVPHKLTPEAIEGLRERWFGDLVGTPSADYDWRLAPPNGETLEIFIERAQLGLRQALSPQGLSALVAHGGTLYVLSASLDLELETADYANCTPLLIERAGRGWRVTRLAASTGAGDNIS